jgi:hypothetical protein
MTDQRRSSGRSPRPGLAERIELRRARSVMLAELSLDRVRLSEQWTRGAKH